MVRRLKLWATNIFCLQYLLLLYRIKIAKMEVAVPKLSDGEAAEMVSLVKMVQKVHIVPTRENYAEACSTLIEIQGFLVGVLTYRERPHFWAHRNAAAE